MIGVEAEVEMVQVFVSLNGKCSRGNVSEDNELGDEEKLPRESSSSLKIGDILFALKLSNIGNVYQ